MRPRRITVIFGRSFIVLLVPFPVLKPFKNEIKCFSAFVSCQREERTISPGLPPMEESNEAGTETEACKGNGLQSLARCPWKPGSVTAAYLCRRPEAPASPSRNNFSFLWHYLLCFQFIVFSGITYFTAVILSLRLGHQLPFVLLCPELSMECSALTASRQVVLCPEFRWETL